MRKTYRHMAQLGAKTECVPGAQETQDDKEDFLDDISHRHSSRKVLVRKLEKLLTWSNKLQAKKCRDEVQQGLVSELEAEWRLAYLDNDRAEKSMV